VFVVLEDHWETVGRLAPAGCNPTEDFCRQRKEVPSGRLMDSVMAALAPLRASRPFAGLTDRHTREEPPVSSLRFQITPTTLSSRSMPVVQMIESQSPMVVSFWRSTEGATKFLQTAMGG
jgi:hypothetical protein